MPHETKETIPAEVLAAAQKERAANLAISTAKTRKELSAARKAAAELCGITVTAVYNATIGKGGAQADYNKMKDTLANYSF